MLYKTVSEVVAALAAPFSLPTFTKPGTQFTYVPWTESKKLLDEVFGIFGWSTTEPKVLFAPMNDGGKATGVYTVTFGLVVKAIDDETSAVIEKMLPCVGQGVSYGADDNSAKSAMSDALSRGVKMLGEAFGFGLYSNKGGQQAAARPASQANATAPRPSTNGGSGDRRPSPKQFAMLHDPEKLGFSEDEIAAMDFPTWKGHIDAYVANGYQKPQAEVAAPRW